MSQLINELLILEGHQTKKLTEINLSKIIFAEVESLQGAYQQKFITDLNPNISYRITKGDFQSLVHNLLVFERFYREDESHSNKVAGSGIGLSIVKMIIEKYHGKITIRDNEPSGTIFTVYLPK